MKVGPSGCMDYNRESSDQGHMIRREGETVSQEQKGGCISYKENKNEREENRIRFKFKSIQQTFQSLPLCWQWNRNNDSDSGPKQDSNPGLKSGISQSTEITSNIIIWHCCKAVRTLNLKSKTQIHLQVT